MICEAGYHPAASIRTVFTPSWAGRTGKPCSVWNISKMRRQGPRCRELWPIPDRENCRNGLLNPCHEIAEGSGQVQARAKTTATKPCGHMRGSTKLDIHDDLVRICEQIYLYRCKVTQCCVGADTTVNFHPSSICECKGHPVLL